MTRTPDLFIIGAPKSGTTSLYEYLKGHPELYLSEVKEPCYYARDLARDVSGSFLVYGRDDRLYSSLFAGAGDAKRVGEASTRYLYSKDAPDLIRADQPDARIVAILRNPVDMIHSLHAHKLAAATEDIADFEQALAAEDDRRAGRRIPVLSNPCLATYRDRARYGEQLGRWLAAFAPDRVHVIVFEEMVREPAAELRKLLEFLDVDPAYQPSSFRAHNIAHGTRSPSIRRLFASRPAQFLAWSVLPRLLGDARTRRLVTRVSKSSLQRRQIKREHVAPELRRRLEEEFAADVALLSSLLGRDMASLWFGDRRQLASQWPAEVSIAPLSGGGPRRAS